VLLKKQIVFLTDDDEQYQKEKIQFGYSFGGLQEKWDLTSNMIALKKTLSVPLVWGSLCRMQF
jgi:hypothetical protein